MEKLKFSAQYYTKKIREQETIIKQARIGERGNEITIRKEC